MLQIFSSLFQQLFFLFLSAVTFFFFFFLSFLVFPILQLLNSSLLDYHAECEMQFH